MIADQINVLNDSLFSSCRHAVPIPSRRRRGRWNPSGSRWSRPRQAWEGHEQALYEGDAGTLNVYAANIGGGSSDGRTSPKGYNSGRDFIDGIVILDESMPGGKHERQVLARRHAHARGRPLADAQAYVRPRVLGLRRLGRRHGARGDAAVRLSRWSGHMLRTGEDPIYNFMDYSQDSCMWMFTPGQADRMSDAWLQFRAEGGKGQRLAWTGPPR